MAIRATVTAPDKTLPENVNPSLGTNRGFYGNSTEHALKAKRHHASYHRDGFLPLCNSFGSEDPQCGSGDEVALKVEGVVNRTVHADKTLGGSS